ncbi:hypothetical protein, partial [Shigella sonnei]|uniref:hypothetical protein n=1 Tax=Shigella sonnei TaxID=624 RepID=UPI001C0A6F36
MKWHTEFGHLNRGQQNNITEQEMVRSQTFPHNIVSVQITTFVSNLAGAGSGNRTRIISLEG